MCCSVLMTLFGAPQPYKRVSSYFVKFTWLLFTFVSHFGFLNAIFWWLFIWEKGVTTMDWLNLVPHAILPFTVFFDGTNVNRIPLRWQHYWGFAVPMECCYVLWTYLQNEVFEVENPELLKNDTDIVLIVTAPTNATDSLNVTDVVENFTQAPTAPNITSHYIYEEYNWKEEGTDPLVISAIGIFALGPPLFLIMWLFTQYLVICLCLWDRRLYYTDPRANRPKRRYAEGAGLAMSSMRRNSFDEDEDSYSSDFDSQEESDEESSSRPQEESSNRESSNREESSYSQQDEEDSYSQQEEKVEDEPMGVQPKRYRSKLEALAYDDA